MTGNRDAFMTLDDSIKSEVKIRDGRRLAAKGRGDVLLLTKQGKKGGSQCAIFTWIES